jgi:hypothetical protein
MYRNVVGDAIPPLAPTSATRIRSTTQHVLVTIDLGDNRVIRTKKVTVTRSSKTPAVTPWHALYAASRKLRLYPFFGSEDFGVLTQILDRRNENAALVEEHPSVIMPGWYWFLFADYGVDLVLSRGGKFSLQQRQYIDMVSREDYLIGGRNGFRTTNLMYVYPTLSEEIADRADQDPEFADDLQLFLRKHEQRLYPHVVFAFRPKTTFDGIPL